MHSGTEFDLSLEKFGKEIPEAMSKIHRAVALEGLRGLVQMTPVKDGRARADWQVSNGSPATGETGAFDKAGGATIAAGSAEIANAKPFSVTHIANNVPYIEELENGSSKQAPGGMLALTYQRLTGWLARRR